MATAASDEAPTFRCDSPTPSTSPTPALGACPELSRCLSTASSASHGSATTDASHVRESLGSDLSAGSRQSSGSYSSYRRSDVSDTNMLLKHQSSIASLDAAKPGQPRRRGYTRPQGTDFAASARSRESVLSLGSITHLQYYFARTGLLEGKGAQNARKRQQNTQTLDLSGLDTASFLNVSGNGDIDSSYASMGSSQDLGESTHGSFGAIIESPVEEFTSSTGDDDEVGGDEFEYADANMLPPTQSTYNYREKPLAKPPSIAELKADLNSTLDEASKALAQAAGRNSGSPPTSPPRDNSGAEGGGWHEIEGMHILDVMTLAIRAAKVYYTAHEQPDKLDAIRPEKMLRSDLLAVMDVLRRMATRGFVGGIRPDEHAAMAGWIASMRDVLAAEERADAADAAERRGWTWLDDAGWEGREYEREYAFMQSMLAGAASHPVAPLPVVSSPTAVNRPCSPTADGGSDAASSAATAPAAHAPTDPLPPWTPIDRTAPLSQQSLPTPFLSALRSGVRLVQLHNCAVRRSRRRFGAIAAWHTDTAKPYRAADNLRFWVKAAELRWEILLRVDALGVVYGSSDQVWIELEDAVLAWCRGVRREIAAEVRAAVGA